MIDILLGPRGRIYLRGTLDLPLRVSVVWGQMRHFAHFITLDPFHVHIDIIDNQAETAARLVIHHRFFLIHIIRVGHILKWREGQGYSFSDLSKRGPRVGFPHVFTYDVQSNGIDASRLSITVRGRWTANFLPQWAIKLWLRWVLGRTLDRVQQELLTLAILRNAD